MDPNISDPAKEREDNMSSLAVGFAMRMHKREASAQGETILGSEVYGGKRPEQSSPDEEAQRSPTTIVVDSLKRASDALPALEGAA